MGSIGDRGGEGPAFGGSSSIGVSLNSLRTIFWSFVAKPFHTTKPICGNHRLLHKLLPTQIKIEVRNPYFHLLRRCNNWHIFFWVWIEIEDNLLDPIILNNKWCSLVKEHKNWGQTFIGVACCKESRIRECALERIKVDEVDAHFTISSTPP